VSDFDKDLYKFALRYGYQISDSDHSEPSNTSLVHAHLFDAFELLGHVEYSEQGCGPANYLWELIDVYLQQIPGNSWKVYDCDSDDGWMTAKVELVSSDGETYQFVLEDIFDSDWVPAQLPAKMRAFSKENCDKTLVTFFGDDPFVILAMPHNAAEEIYSLIRKHAGLTQSD
jgi:hypothetical protein|tara:strand:+ start:6368 stop:6883 length:516 start_codon:yes stop_codon:yes gene_type:complete